MVTDKRGNPRTKVTKLLFVFGTRPEAIKMAPVILKLNENAEFHTVVCVTAQHRKMLDQVLMIFSIVPDYDLNIMKKDQDLFDITSSSLLGLKEVMKKENPDMVLVQGDTTTAFVAGLAAFYLKIPIGHIEAGLRTSDKYSPFPEEKNRHLLSVISDYHFAPTRWAKHNLVKEGVPQEKIWVTGNTVIDALLTVVSKQSTEGKEKIFDEYFQKKWNIYLNNGSQYILVTGHRRENFGKGFENICWALKEIAERQRDVSIIYPVHLNPNVQRPVKRILNGKPNIHLIEPLEYELFVYLMKRSRIILTDSGGVQEEALSLGKPVLLMRNTTERPEGVEAGTVELVGTDRDRIIEKGLALLTDEAYYKRMSSIANPYGDGNAAKRIVEILQQL